MSHHIRRSQFILTWGVGAILESSRGSRIIPRPDIGLFEAGISKINNPSDFEIYETRLTKSLLGGKRIFRIPSNAEIEADTDAALYRTKIFPDWRICSDHWILHHRKQGCPDCRKKGRQVLHTASRFVLACPKGHLDDVDWSYIVHSAKGGKCTLPQPPRYYHWKGAGGALKEISIECPHCRESVSLGKIYTLDWMCSGRFPEREPLYRRLSGTHCNEPAKIVLRQASYIRIPEIISLFSIPPRHSRLHELLEIPAIRSALRVATPSNKPELERILSILLKGGDIPLATKETIINRYDWLEINQAIHDILSGSSLVRTHTDLLIEELEALTLASKNGSPPVRDPTFEVRKSDVKVFSGPNGTSFRVVPVTRLKTTIVQRGYRRLDPENTLVDISFRDKTNSEWLPGVTFLGEGLFIMFDTNDGWFPGFKGNSWNTWLKCFNEGAKLYKGKSVLFRDSSSLIELHPGFVWWHTFSHFLLRVLSVDSGYSTASIRERVYLQIKPSGIRGGVILYTVQPGEGTLGGLIMAANHFPRLVSRSIELAETCPNDPLCFEQEFTLGSNSGSACYGCLLVSETSCEHRNMWLDRHLFLEAPP